MKKILFVTNTFPKDEKLSSGVFNYNAANQLSNVCDLTIVHLRSWRPFRKILQKKTINHLSVLCFSFPFYPVKSNFLTGLQLFFYQFFFRLLLREKLRKQDVIHSVGASFSGVIGSYLSLHLKKPHIAQCIGTDVNVILPNKKDSFFYQVMKSHVDIYTTNSFALEKQVNSMYPDVKVKTIYRGVDLGFFASDKNEIKNSIIRFAFIGGLSYREEHHAGRDYKGGVTLLKAWQLLENHSGVELYFAGPAVTLDLVKKILGQDPRELNIKVSSYLNREAVKNLFISSDVVVIPSWLEGLPNAGMEALASSCAILGANVGGIPELIHNNGYLFEPGDIIKLEKVLREMISSPDRLSFFKKNSGIVALEKFESQQFSKLYCELYENL
ncbi:glycosyltransferase family 4 protein [Thiopseudomonas alkaliphila]|uniref:glycosyltransferase family 4 protein n=1 Tax=Thiopseudomonas alkaliphila TaxID=1697053 RepID=UPI00069DE780|nr:glycosyltransferase family 4 protein [Thiopseudomonas alkaliphila]AKX52908.1 hypothetical protein AKN91_03925 [Thiopseudomonas alkaliphila]